MSTNLTSDMSHGEGSSDYGELFWKIGLPDGRQVSIHADAIDVVDGALVTKSHGKALPNEFAGLILAPGQWEYAYAASVFEGNAIAIDYMDADHNRST
jgi:hypothetical protein